jgi:DNA-binding transcriptional ArsR family regulator
MVRGGTNEPNTMPEAPGAGQERRVGRIGLTARMPRRCEGLTSQPSVCEETLAPLSIVRLDLPFVATNERRLEVLADPSRRSIVERLATGPSAVGELARQLSISRPAVSQHLKVLKDAGLVTDRPRGTRRMYQVDPDGLRAVRTYLDGLWQDALQSFQAAAEQHEGTSDA